MSTISSTRRGGQTACLLDSARSGNGARLRVAMVLAALVVGCGCVTRPQEISGHKVVGTRWVNGHVVYVLADSEADKQRMRDSAEEADEAARSVVFHPTRPR